MVLMLDLFVTPLVRRLFTFFPLIFQIGKILLMCPQIHRLLSSVISILFIIVFFSSIMSIWFSHIISISLLRFSRLFHLFEELGIACWKHFYDGCFKNSCHILFHHLIHCPLGVYWWSSFMLWFSWFLVWWVTFIVSWTFWISSVDSGTYYVFFLLKQAVPCWVPARGLSRQVQLPSGPW